LNENIIPHKKNNNFLIRNEEKAIVKKTHKFLRENIQWMAGGKIRCNVPEYLKAPFVNSYLDNKEDTLG
jgi:hypothetical protein